MTATTLILLSLISTSGAFTFAPSLHKTRVTTFSPARTISNPSVRIRHTTFLSASDGEDAEAVAEDNTTDEVVKVEEEEPKEEEKPKEDPEVTAIKEEISKLEGELKSKNLQLNRVKNEADEFTESGYMRKCAEMDNTRRMRAVANNNNEEASRATTIQEFLPVLDELRNLDVTFSDDEFAKSYTALGKQFESSLTGLGLTQFSVAGGDELNRSRMAVVGEEYSDDVKKGIVMREERAGIEVTGNVIRLADCVVSLGSEAEAIKEAEEKAKAAAEAKAKEEATDVEVEEVVDEKADEKTEKE